MPRKFLMPPQLPPLQAAAHKGDAGRLLLIAGSRRYSGAPRLALSGALAAGAGLVHVAAPHSVIATVAQHDPGVITHGLPETSIGTLAYRGGRHLLELAEGMDAVLLGPGLGDHRETRCLARRLGALLSKPTVVDADGLNALGSGEFPGAGAHRIYTPHPGEAARLLGTTVGEVQKHRDASATELQRRLGGVVVLKGAGTLVVGEGSVAENTNGNRGLARGGSGDLLAGLMAALLLRGVPPIDAAQAAVYLHGAAADAAAVHHGYRGLTLQRLGEALSVEIRRCE